MKVNFSQISDRTLERLPAYYHILRSLRKEGIKFISTTTIAKKMGLKPIQVRKDISITGIIGKPKIGYEVDVLLAHLDDFMGWNTHTKAVIAGCGNLGLSLINYKDFDRYGFDIVAGFDIDGKKIGTKTNNKPIYSIEQLSSYIKKNNIEIGIITVSEKDAQKIANVFVENGIRAIWNFAPVTLALPDNVAIQQQDMSPSLAVLIKKINLSRDCSNKKQ